MECLRETLEAQQELLQKLYNELDVERESSSIAADEALSMILRLQAEKASVGMEASQYKRIAEEKMCHAQEMLEMFQDLIYQKEMQIAYLHFKLGCNNHHPQYSDNILSRTARTSLRRGTSLPRESNSVGEDIKKLDERIKELAITKVTAGAENVKDIFEVPKIDFEGKIVKKSTMFFKNPTYGVGEFEVHELNRRVKQLEDERFVPSTGVSENNEEIGGKELELLRDIRNKVDTMEAQILSLRTKKPLLTKDQSVGCIKEVMLCFWPWSKA